MTYAEAEAIRTGCTHIPPGTVPTGYGWISWRDGITACALCATAYWHARKAARKEQLDAMRDQILTETKGA